MKPRYDTKTASWDLLTRSLEPDPWLAGGCLPPAYHAPEIWCGHYNFPVLVWPHFLLTCLSLSVPFPFCTFDVFYRAWLVLPSPCFYQTELKWLAHEPKCLIGPGWLIVLLLTTPMKHTGKSVFVEKCDWVCQLVKSWRKLAKVLSCSQEKWFHRSVSKPLVWSMSILCTGIFFY